MSDQIPSQKGTLFLLGRTNRLFEILPVLAGLLYIAFFIYVAVNRMGYPYDLEWMEGGIVSHVLRLLHGEPLYTAPSPEFAAYRYTPLYYYLGVLLTPVLGEGYLPLRLISFLSTLGSIGLIAIFIYKDTSNWKASLISAGFFAATYSVNGFWFDVARNDTMFLFFMLLALYILRYSVNVRGVLLAALASYLAFMTKQSVLPIVLVPGLVLLFYYRKLAVLYFCALIFLIVSSSLILDRLSDGWYYYYVFKLGSGLTKFPWDLPHAIRRFSTEVILPQFWVVVLLAFSGAFWKSLFRLKSWASGFELAVSVSLIGSSFVLWANYGSYYNVYIPLYLALAFWFGKAFHTLQTALRGKYSPGRTFALAVLSALCLLQFKNLWYSPSEQIPTAAQHESNEKLIAFLSTFDGKIFVPFHSYIPYQAGKKGAIDRQALWDILRGERERVRQNLIDSMRVAMNEKRFEAIILDHGWYDQKLLERNYYLAESPECLLDTTTMTTGWSIRPKQLWLPKPDSVSKVNSTQTEDGASSR